MRTPIALLSLLLLFVPAAYGAEDEPPGFDAATFSGLEFREIGPALKSGRIADIVLHPENRAVRYVAVGSGGIWKTVNAGTTWSPVFEDEASYSIGALALDPSDPDTIWAGTGENVSGRHVGFGDGVYVSHDGGGSWENKGLGASERIGMIRVDPRDSDVVYVAAQGPLWSAGGERGLYKTTDGGETWTKLLGDGLGNSDEDDAYTGVSEVHLDPRDPDVVYAVSWQRYRNVAVLLDGGPGSGIHKSTDGGATWTELTRGLPEGVKGKIGLAISPIDPDVVYATIELAQREGGFWRSADGGASWEKRGDYLSGGTGPHYYQEIFASPHVFDRVYQMDVRLHRTDDGGRTFVTMDADDKHVDHHALAFDPADPNFLIVGNDGGVYESFDEGATWRFAANLPITQFYKVTVDYDVPFYNVYGGTQDNNSLGGPSRTDSLSGIVNGDWFVTRGGDGHQSFADPSNPNILYAESQQGYLSRFDRATGEGLGIRPEPAPGEPQERFNWDAPILISPHDPERLYFASSRVWRSDSRGDDWRPVSGHLVREEDRLRQPLMGRRWGWDAPWDLMAMSQFHTITSLSESPLVEGLLYAGTDDGLVHVSEDGGENWRTIDRLPGVPQGFFVNDVKADLHDPDTVYVVVDDHKSGDFSPYVLKSTNRGRSWRSIAADLPERHVLWRIVQDHVKPELLFLGTEFGVFFTVDGGERWTQLDGGLPTIPFRDLVIQTRENDLVGATFGRGFWVLDDYTPLRDVDAAMLAEGVTFFPVRKTPWYLPRTNLGCRNFGCTGDQGDDFWNAHNPPFGAVFTYYLAEDVETREAAREAAEKAAAKENDDAAFPTWDALVAERGEDAPAMVFTVRDAAGAVVRHVEGPAKAGFHRVAWDLRYPDLDAWSEGETAEDAADGAVLVAPGTYEVALYERRDGVLRDTGQRQTVVLESIRAPTLEGPSQDERVAFQAGARDLARIVDGTVEHIDAQLAMLGAVKTVLRRSTADLTLHTRADGLTARLQAQRDVITGDQTRSGFGDLGPVSVYSRLRAVIFGGGRTAYGPTPAQQDALADARRLYEAVHAELSGGIARDLDTLRRDLDAAGVPWTPGRASLPAPGR